MPRAPAVVVFDPQGKKLRQIPAQPRRGEIVSPHSLDVDASGRVYIADLGGNAVTIYAVDGTLFAHFRIPAPTQIIALPHYHFAVCGGHSQALTSVYYFHGPLL